jgi:peroxiredoxin
MSLTVGQPAPDFTLPSSEKEMISLSGLAGKPVLILFFPFAFTGVCTNELCNIRNTFNVYDKTEVLAISVDSPFTLGKFKEENNFPFKMLSDFNKTTSQAYGAFYQDFVLGLHGVSKRSAFVLDADHNVAYAEVLEDAGSLPNFEAIQAVIDTLNA